MGGISADVGKDGAEVHDRRGWNSFLCLENSSQHTRQFDVRHDAGWNGDVLVIVGAMVIEPTAQCGHEGARHHRVRHLPIADWRC